MSRPRPYTPKQEAPVEPTPEPAGDVTVTNRAEYPIMVHAKGQQINEVRTLEPGRNTLPRSEWEAMAPHLEGLTQPRATETGDMPPVLEVY